MRLQKESILYREAGDTVCIGTVPEAGDTVCIGTVPEAGDTVCIGTVPEAGDTVCIGTVSINNKHIISTSLWL